MRVVCKYNKISSIKNIKRQSFLKQEYSLDELDRNDESSFTHEIVIGKEYLVYGVESRGNKVIYFIFEEKVDERCPYPYESDFFEITDSRLSSYWKINVYSDENDEEITSQLAYPEWIENPVHCENLIDGDQEAEEVFRKYKTLMDKEFVE